MSNGKPKRAPAPPKKESLDDALQRFMDEVINAPAGKPEIVWYRDEAGVLHCVVDTPDGPREVEP